MKVTRAQASANRKRIVETASTLYRKHGFDGIGLAAIMKAAGLTHGTFYCHFASKDHLAAEACAHALSQEYWEHRGDPCSLKSLEAVVRRYLSKRHRDDRAHGSLVAALGSDIVRQPGIVRRAFTEGLRSGIEALCRFTPGPSAFGERQEALAMLAGLVGALTLSRAVNDRKLSDEILQAGARTFGRHCRSGKVVAAAAIRA
jgi:TetR/AcrR family transcriptional repressor of nem operon